jgi:hypothetical protein
LRPESFILEQMKKRVRLATTLLLAVVQLFGSSTARSAEKSFASKIVGPYVSGIGLSYGMGTDTRETARGTGNPVLRFNDAYGVESIHDMLIGVPLLTIHGYGNLSLRKGRAEYLYVGDSPLATRSGSGVQFTAWSFETGFGPRFRPFPYSFIGPFADLGFGLGVLRLSYDDDNMGAKVGPPPYATVNLSWYYDVFAEAGLELRFHPFGFEALVRRKYSRVFTNDTLPTLISGFYQTDFVVLLMFGF